MIAIPAEKDELILIDEENDAVTATNRLLWTNPCLHENIEVRPARLHKFGN